MSYTAEKGSISPVSSTDETLYIISDLHLGEACKNFSRIEYLKLSASMDQRVTTFLEHLCDAPAGPKRLLLGGDLFDFLQVTVVPAGASEDAQEDGLGTNEDESRWKMERLMERHRSVFIHLADFVGRGNHLDIVQGNHDTELFWPAVQGALIDGLADLYFGDEGASEDDRAIFTMNVSFHGWFFYQPGRLYFEHGHRFDEFCATPPQLYPVLPRAERLDDGSAGLNEPISAFAIRYFANRQSGFQTHDKEHWGLSDYLGYFRGHGDTGLMSLFSDYARLALKVIAASLHRTKADRRKSLSEHDARRRILAADVGISEAAIQELESLGAQSMMERPREVLSTLGVTNMLIWLGFIGTMTALTFLATTWWELTLYTALASLVGVVAQRTFSSKVSRDIRTKLSTAAEEVGEILQVPIVGFGHSHGPVVSRRRRQHWGYYVNSGSFLNHAATHDYGAPCNCSQTFIKIEPPGPHRAPKPTLYRWCYVEESARPFTPK